MCGISGLVGLADQALARAMANAQAHRGPDDVGTITLNEHQVSLAHRRLSIIDLSPAGHQPMSNAAGDLWITFNGEIYNYLEIRHELLALGHQFKSHSDTEVLLAAYEVWGNECLARLNGMFAFAIYDVRKKRLFAARDRLGIKPFYYFHRDGLFVFASEIKSLFACPGVPKRPDLAALATPARFQVSPFTGFEEIFKLPPGHSLTFERDRLTVRPYWTIEISEDAAATDSDVIERLDELLKDAVRLQMIADVPVGVFLSGGLDSSIISALMRENTTKDIHAFTIRFSEKDQRFERMPDDSYYARQVAKQFKFQYNEIEIEPKIEELLPKMVWHLDEPLSDPATINTYLISQAAREKNIIVLLNGMGGDEIFGGYRKQLACLRADLYQRVVPKVVRSAIERGFRQIPVATSARGLRTLRWGKRFASFASLDKFDRYLASDLSLSQEQYGQLFRNGVDYESSHFYTSQRQRFDSNNASYLTKMCLNDTNVFLPEHNLLYSDKATMAAGIEGRPPLTDHRLVEFMFSLPPRFRIRGNVQKFILKKVSERYLPRNIIYRPKAPFGSPLRSWIRGPLAGMIDDLLAESSMRSRDLYEPKYVREIISRDRSGLEDNALVIWTLLTNELWFRMNFGAN
jgi:asparagine synthase (glutamine-hydrolysing)